MDLATSQYRTVRDESAIRDLVDYVNSPARYRPVLIVSGTNRAGRTNYPAALAAETLPDVDVYWVPDQPQQWRLSELIGEELRVFQGGARIIWPLSEGRRCRFFKPPQSAAEAGIGLRLMEDALAGVTAVERPAPGIPAHAEKVAELQAEVAGLRRELGLTTAQLGEAVAGRRRAEETLRKERKKKTNGSASEPEEPVVFADPAEQFQHEVWLTYLRTVPEGERDTWELRDYTFGPDWFCSLDVAERRKVVAVVVEILTRRAIEIAGRSTRQLHEGRGQDGKLVTRPDGSTAWRANIQTGAPQARRIMWWELPDGTVELAKVALHDDVRIR